MTAMWGSYFWPYDFGLGERGRDLVRRFLDLAETVRRFVRCIESSAHAVRSVWPPSM
jgi:hypothetical protein